MMKRIIPYLQKIDFYRKLADDPTFPECRLQRMFYIFLISWGLLWFLLPLFFLEDSFIDVLENIVWGSHFQLGYDKNPWFGAWTGYFFYLITGKSLWINYLLSQLFVATGITSVWFLAKRMVSPAHAYIAAVSLAGINFYGIKSVEFCDDVIALGLWPLIYLFFYKALNDGKSRYWLLTGIFAGLALMTKYLAPVIFISMFIVMMATPRGRKAFSRPGVYLAGVILLLISLPNFLFLVENKGTAISYAFSRAGLSNELIIPWPIKIKNPLYALNRAAGVLVLILLPLSIFFRRVSDMDSPSVKDEQYRFDRIFITILCWMPFILILLFSLITGARINYSWVVPCFPLCGLFLVFFYRPATNCHSLRLFNMIIIAIGIMFASIFAIRSAWHQVYVKSNCDYENFPSRAFAREVTESWRKNFAVPLKYVIGDRQTSCAVAIYSEERPEAFFNANPLMSPWICPDDVRKQGAVLIWYGKPDRVPAFIHNFVRDSDRITSPRMIQSPRAVPAWFRQLVRREPLPVNASYMFMAPTTGKAVVPLANTRNE